MAGELLTQAPTPSGTPTGVALVASGAWADHLAVSDQFHDQIHYVDLAGTHLTSFPTNVSAELDSNTPGDVAFIASTASGIYDEHLAISDHGANKLYLVTQNGAWVSTIDTSSFAPTIRGVAHIPGSDKLLLADEASTVFIVDFDGTVSSQYDTAPFGTAAPKGVAINPLTCEHVLGDATSDLVVYLNRVGPLRVLLVVSTASPLNPQEEARKNLIESWGHTVNPISASDSQANFDSAVTANDVAYVVEQQQSTVLGTKLRDARIGVVNEEVELRDQFGFASNRDWPTPIDAGGLEVLGTLFWSGADTPALAVIDTGGALYGGGTAAARRVQLPWGRHTGGTPFDFGKLNDDGKTILRRAIEWASEAGVTPPPQAATITLTPSQDTFLGGESTTAYGANSSLFLGFGAREWRPLLQFDVTAIPAGALITSATLRLHNWDDGASTAGPLSVQAHRVTEPWTATWANKGANWYDRMKQGGGALPWATPGGTFAAGWSASASFDSTLAPQWVEWNLSPLVQEWVDGISPNQGVLLVPDAGSAWANLRSSDFSDTVFHPQLVIEYTEP
jgi:hypothetical protein